MNGVLEEKILSTRHLIPPKALVLKNKTKTYVLIATVIGVWGTIAYKIISGINPSEELPIAQEIDKQFRPKVMQQKDTFSISLAPRDPFLGTLYVADKQTRKPKKQSNTKIEQANLPTITYGGLIKKQGSKEQVFVININDQQFLLKKGQTIDGITLMSGDSKNIRVKVQGKIQTIPIQ